MKFPFLASFIVFTILVTYELAKHRNQEQKAKETFWAREARANQTRRKPLDSLDYIVIPFRELPMELLCDDETVASCLEAIRSLQSEKIVNLTGISNTDLKLKYGAPNITLLMQYDQNYTLLARTLQKWAGALHQAGYMQEARTVLEFAVSTGTDISASYFLLSGIYRSQGCPEKIKDLIARAETLNSAMRPSIVRTLKESCQSYGLPDCASDGPIDIP